MKTVKKNQQDKYINYVKKRLDDWCEWYSQENSFGIGYASYTPEYQLMLLGIVNHRSSWQNFPVNCAAEEIEWLVNEMAQQNLNMATALRYYYFTDGALRTKAKKLSISHSVLKAYVDMAHQWLIGRLSFRFDSTKM